MTTDSLKQFYDRISLVYDALADESERFAIEKAIDALHIDKDQSVLEIGFGTGYGLKLLAKAVGKHGSVQGVDFSPQMVKLAEHQLEAEGLFDQVTVQIGNVPPLDFDDNQFDAVFMSFFLELLSGEDRQQLLKEIRRVLHDDGQLGLVFLATSEDADPIQTSQQNLQSRFPHIAGRKAINPNALLNQFGFQYDKVENTTVSGLPVTTIIACCVRGDSSELSFNIEPATIDSLIDQLGSNKPDERMTARQALVDFGYAATNALCTALTSDDNQVRWESGKCLAAIADPATAKPLVQELYDRDSDAGWVASEALVRIGSPSLVPLLTALTKSKSVQSYNFYHAAHHVLRELSHGQNGKLLAELNRAFGDSEPQVRVPVEASKVLEQLRKQ